jgi:hypothetical protein
MVFVYTFAVGGGSWHLLTCRTWIEHYWYASVLWLVYSTFKLTSPFRTETTISIANHPCNALYDVLLHVESMSVLLKNLHLNGRGAGHGRPWTFKYTEKEIAHFQVSCLCHPQVGRPLCQVSKATNVVNSTHTDRDLQGYAAYAYFTARRLNFFMILNGLPWIPAIHSMCSIRRWPSGPRLCRSRKVVVKTLDDDAFLQAW